MLVSSDEMQLLAQQIVGVKHRVSSLEDWVNSLACRAGLTGLYGDYLRYRSARQHLDLLRADLLVLKARYSIMVLDIFEVS